MKQDITDFFIILALCSVLMICGTAVGYSMGKKDIQTKAIKLGIAYWQADKNGDPILFWNTNSVTK